MLEPLAALLMKLLVFPKVEFPGHYWVLASGWLEHDP
jgi:hypothetical protein